MAELMVSVSHQAEKSVPEGTLFIQILRRFKTVLENHISLPSHQRVFAA